MTTGSNRGKVTVYRMHSDFYEKYIEFEVEHSGFTYMNRDASMIITGQNGHNKRLELSAFRPKRHHLPRDYAVVSKLIPVLDDDF